MKAFYPTKIIQGIKTQSSYFQVSTLLRYSFSARLKIGNEVKKKKKNLLSISYSKNFCQSNIYYLEGVYNS